MKNAKQRLKYFIRITKLSPFFNSVMKEEREKILVIALIEANIKVFIIYLLNPCLD